MGTPIPKIGRDSPTKSDVITYKLSPEELAKYQIGRNKPMPKAPITKEQYLEMRKSGMSRTAITRELKTNPSTFYGWLGEWGIREIAVEESILLEMSSTKTADKPGDKQPSAPEGTGDVAGSADGESGTADQTAEEEQVTDLKPNETQEVFDSKISTFQQIGLDVGALVAEKNKTYGDSFAKCGEFLTLLYPKGVHPDQYGDMLTIVRVFDKLMRIATDKDALGESPWKDVCGYSILAQASDLKQQDTSKLQAFLDGK